MKYHKLEKIVDEITEIPFSLFYNKFKESNDGNFIRVHAFSVWWSMLEHERKEAFTVICQKPKLRGLNPDTFLKLFKS